MRTFGSLGAVMAGALALAACGQQLDAGDSAPGGADAGGGVSFGGAQDFGEFRGLLERGEVPGPTTLDANGFFNEHYAEPPAASCGGTLCINGGLTVGRDWIRGEYQAALQIAVSTNVDPADYPRLPMNLVVVVDHSGSMASDDRLGKVKAGLAQLIDNLGATDRMALISFDDVVTVNAPFTDVLDRANLKAKVAALTPRGGTNLHDGLRAGLDMLGEFPPSDKQNRVIFLSDGLATAGNTDPAAIIAMATSRISRGIGLTTIGVGNDFDAPLMRGLAERGAGNFYYVEDAAAATEVFDEELAYFLAPIALDIEITARAGASWQMLDVVGSTLWQAGPRLGRMQIPAVFLASRVSQQPGPGGGRRGGGSMIFIGLEPLASSVGVVADLELSYRVAGGSERVSDTIRIAYDRDPQQQQDEPYLSYPAMAERFAMYNMFLAFRSAAEFAVFDWGCAAATLTAARATGATWAARHEADLDLAADLALAARFHGILVEQGAPEVELSRCVLGNPTPYPPYPYEPVPIDDDVHYAHGCADVGAGGAGGGLAVLGALLGVLARRRRSARA